MKAGVKDERGRMIKSGGRQRIDAINITVKSQVPLRGRLGSLCILKSANKASQVLGVARSGPEMRTRHKKL